MNVLCGRFCDVLWTFYVDVYFGRFVSGTGAAGAGGVGAVGDSPGPALSLGVEPGPRRQEKFGGE